MVHCQLAVTVRATGRNNQNQNDSEKDMDLNSDWVDSKRH